MRRVIIAVAVLAAIVAAYQLGRRNPPSQTGSQTARRVLYYVDPMHPAYRSDKAGIAPDCGMKLEPVFASAAGNAVSSPALAQLPEGAVNIDSATQRLLGIQLAQVEKSSGARTIRVLGRVVPEDTRVYSVNSGVDGFIRGTYNDSVGNRVKKDQKLATFYSPDFLSVASGFLAAVQGVPGAVGKDGARTMPFPGALAKQGVSSLQGYTDRLRNLGMSDVQIQHVAESHQLPESIDILAPADGFILARSVSPGQHFTHEMEFYRIADLRQVWVVAEVGEQEAAYLRPGGVAQMTLRGEGRRLLARVTDSLPQSEIGGGTVKFRLEAENPAFILRPEMLVDLELPVRVPAAITVPLDALVDSGASARVYVARSDDVFEPREVKIGWRFGDRVEILRGVRPGERVVASATFLVDSESRLKTPASPATNVPTSYRTASVPTAKAVAKTTSDPSCGMPVDLAKATASGNTLTYRGTTYYFCSAKCKQTFEDDKARLADRQRDSE